MYYIYVLYHLFVSLDFVIKNFGHKKDLLINSTNPFIILQSILYLIFYLSLFELTIIACSFASSILQFHRTLHHLIP